MKRIVLFYGAYRDYKNYLTKNNIILEEVTLFPEIISQYNETIRASNKGYMDHTNKFYTDEKVIVENIVIMQNDFSSVLEHVLSNFSHIISLAHNAENLYIQNPPKRVVESLISSYPEDIIEYECSEYPSFSIHQIGELKQVLDDNVLGQSDAKFSILSSLYQLTKKKDDRPIVLHFYGPSGVGKTELAKSISDYFGGELLKIQFSMMQTAEANNYIFGDKHSKPSFAKDLLSRESNIVLIDEFDKVNPYFYNAFYEVFDEGVYRDLNYSVNVKDVIFILTSNFSSEEEFIKIVGPAMASRIGKSIKFQYLDLCTKKQIIQKRYTELLKQLDENERKIIENTDLLNWYINNEENFVNIRSLKILIEQDIYDILTKSLLEYKKKNL